MNKRSQLSEENIRAQLSSAGNTGVSDVNLDDGMWKEHQQREGPGAFGSGS